MKTRKLGRTGINVPEICLGTMTWGSQNTEAEAHQQMDYAVERGVNFFDTAEMYPTTPFKTETHGARSALGLLNEASVMMWYWQRKSLAPAVME